MGIFVLSPFLVLAQVTVAFIEMKTPDGRILQLEPGGRFAHVAISHRGRWLHVHPFRGVELVTTEEMEKMGFIAETIRLEQLAELNEGQIRELLGRKYDAQFSWDGEKLYCSELVGKILKLTPTPMSFSAPIWSNRFRELKGSLGLSPDDIFVVLKKKGFSLMGPRRSCSRIWMD